MTSIEELQTELAKSNFYSDGYFRVLDGTDAGSSMIVSGELIESVFSLGWLKSKKDYIDLSDYK